MNYNSGNNLTDKDLVEKVLHGDTHAFGLIIKTTEMLVAQIVFKMISNPGDRKDIAQDIYLKTYTKLPTFQFQSKLSTWIARIAYNTCLDYLRKKKLPIQEYKYNGTGNETNMPDPANNTSTAATVDDDMPRKDLAGILKTGIEKLSPVYKTLITLYHNEELSYEEIREITGLPAGTIKSYLFRARKELKDNLLLQYKKEDL